MMRRVAVALALILVPVAVMAQEEVPKIEFGVAYENFELSHFNTPIGNANFHKTTSGLSLRGTANIKRWAAIETTLGIVPRARLKEIGGIPADVVLGAQGKVNFLHNEYKFKATARQGDKDQLGLFAFAGPGWIRGDANAPIENATGVDTFTKISFEWGGGVEYYPTRHAGVRIDVSDLMVWLRQIGGIDQPTTNNFVFRAGASFRW